MSDTASRPSGVNQYRITVLLVDDQGIIGEAVRRLLAGEPDIDFHYCGRATEALNFANQFKPTVILQDLVMPDIDGMTLTRLYRENSETSKTPIIVLSTKEEPETKSEAFGLGANDYLVKLPAKLELLARIRYHSKSYINERQRDEAFKALAASEAAQRELLEKTLNGSIKTLTEILSLAEAEFFGRGQRLCEHIRLLVEPLQLTQPWELEVAAMLSQIGFVTVPAPTVQKVRGGLPLNAVEQTLLGRVPEIGSKLLAHIPRLESAAQIILYQNKNFDGTGFPGDALAGEKIPLGARVLRVLLDLLQLESAGQSRRQAFDKLRARKGAYDPKILEAAHKALVETAPSSQARRLVKMRELCAGQVLLSPVETNDGMLIAPAGVQISNTLLEKMNNFAELNGIREPISVSN
jgi:response regulator RpfG family c-di-GMP phosphodiesterase